jgi:D-sedoheptulose 7-phosphate isomerase
LAGTAGESKRALLDLRRIRESISSTAAVLERLRTESAPQIESVARILIERVQEGAKVLLCGNGGSAADSQHVATELTVRYLRDRRAIPAIALTVDSSILTAASNDLGFENVFARQVEALGARGDVLVAISTSGASPNVLRAVEKAHSLGLVTIALTGGDGGKLAGMADHAIVVPSRSTPRIQEAHLVVEHLLCEALEQACGGPS